MQPHRTIDRGDHGCFDIEDIHQDFSALAINLIETLWCKEIEALRANRFHEGLPASGEDHHSVIFVIAYAMKKRDELLMGVAVEQKRSAVAVKGDLQYATFRSGETSVGKGVLVAPKAAHIALLRQQKGCPIQMLEG